MVSSGELGVFLTQVSSGGVAERAGARTNDRLLEVNGASVEQATHEQVVERIRVADGALMFLLVDEDTYGYYQTNQMKVGAGLATVKHLPHQPRIVYLTKGPEGYGFLLREDPKNKGGSMHTHTGTRTRTSTHTHSHAHRHTHTHTYTHTHTDSRASNHS